MKQNRREFISAAVMSGFVSLSATEKVYAEEKQADIKIMATNWGFEGSIDEFCAKVKKDGYDGVELWCDGGEKCLEEIFSAVKKYHLDLAFICGGHSDDHTEHFSEFKKVIDQLANSIQKPLYINCHSGRDYFSYEENKSFIDYTVELSKKSGIRISHETHRARMLYSAPVGKYFMQQNPDLKITLDISHWCNVSETLLHNQRDAVNLAIERTDHIHARIGHEQGPQVNDPRAPEWEHVVNTHLAWWDAVVARKKERGEIITILTEFGPPNYMPTEPYTRKSLSDQWEVNVYMMNLLRKRYLKK